MTSVHSKRLATIVRSRTIQHCRTMIRSSKLILFCVLAVIIILSSCKVESAGKVLDINENLPEFIDKHPDKSWLVKFYAPWCYHCQQLELTYNNVAEKIYRRQSNLVVSRVDCTKYGRVCEKYGVDSYPTIIHITRDTSVKYKGDRSEASIVAFAERLQGPDVNIAHDCNRLKEATNKRGLIVVSTITNSSNNLRLEFESLARAHKSNYWFYQFTGTCGDLISDEGLYLLKRHLNKGIKFPHSDKIENERDGTGLKETIIDWLNRESFPVYGQISYRNIERSLNTGKLLVIAVLEEYKPARRFAKSSFEFHKSFEKLANTYAQYDEQILFGWLSDRELIEYITIRPVSTPNVILLKSDFSYHLLVNESSNNVAKDEDSSKTSDDYISDKLSGLNIRSVIGAAKEQKLTFAGGNNYLYVIMRHIVGNFNKFMNMYRANPLLVSLIFGFPGTIVVIVIYTTCFYESKGGRGDDGDGGEFSDDNDDDEDFDNESDEENQQLLGNGHLKQD